jgi:glycosyltransferase involved in cell wall biosynthesis
MVTHARPQDEIVDKIMKVLQVTPFFGEQFGGTERFCHNLSRKLVERGHEVDVYTARTLASSPKHEVVDGVQVFRFCTPTVIWKINPLTILLHKILRSKYDVIHIHSHLYFSSNQAILARILRLGRFSPLVLHLHGGLGTPPGGVHPGKCVIKRVFDRTVGSITMRTANKIIAQSQADADRASVLYPYTVPKTVVVYNAVDLSHFPAFRSRVNPNGRLIFVGDLETWKGVPTLIEALHILRAWGENFGLTVVGVGTLISQLRKAADGLDVKFLGQQPHTAIPSLMASAFACILPSHWEGIPTVGLEAMAAGVPFVGTNVGGIPEIIRHRETGILVNSHSAERLAEGILLLRDAKLRRKIRAAAYELVVERHNMANIAAKVESVYKNAVQSRVQSC